MLQGFCYLARTMNLIAVLLIVHGRAEAHYGWADVVGDSTQLLSIQPQEEPPGEYPTVDFGSSLPQTEDPPDTLPASPQ